MLALTAYPKEHTFSFPSLHGCQTCQFPIISREIVESRLNMNFIDVNHMADSDLYPSKNNDISAGFLPVRGTG